MYPDGLSPLRNPTKYLTFLENSDIIYIYIIYNIYIYNICILYIYIYISCIISPSIFPFKKPAKISHTWQKQWSQNAVSPRPLPLAAQASTRDLCAGHDFGGCRKDHCHLYWKPRICWGYLLYVYIYVYIHTHSILILYYIYILYDHYISLLLLLLLWLLLLLFLSLLLSLLLLLVYILIINY